MIRHATLSALILLAFCPCLRADSSLAGEAARLLKKHGCDTAKVGVCVLDLSAGKEVLALSADQPLDPASNLKLVTSAAALDLLGADFEFQTVLYRRGDVDASGTLHGDLAVIGSGDPNVSGRFFDGDPTAIFKLWADKLLSAGIKTVQGDLLLDDTLFDREATAPGWPQDQLERWYCAPVSALAFNDDCIDITVSPGRLGAPARVSLSPDTRYVTIDNECSTGESGTKPTNSYARAPGSNKVRAAGEYPAEAPPQTTSVTIHDPTIYFGTVLAETLRAKGIAIAGKPKRVEKPLRPKEDGLAPLTSYAVDLKRTIAVMNKRSQNFYAEQLIKLLGARVRGEGSWKAGTAVAGEFLSKLGARPEEYTLLDGCGLSSGNRVSARVLAAVLAHEFAQPHKQAYIDSLALGGEGTLEKEKRLREADVAPRVHLKTGYIAGASSLSGYVEAEDGRWYAFSILVNRFHSTSDTREFQDDLVRYLVRGK